MRNQRDWSYDERQQESPGFSHGDAQIQPVDPCDMRRSLEELEEGSSSAQDSRSIRKWLAAQVAQLRRVVREVVKTNNEL